MQRVILFLLIILVLTGCKEAPQRHQKAKPQYDIEKVSQNLAHYTQLEGAIPETAEKPEITHKLLDLSDILKESQPAPFDIQRSRLSQFPQDEQPQIVRVSIAIRGVSKPQINDVEEKIWTMLQAHAPQPWELRKASSLDKNETSWARLNVEFKYRSIRLRKASKTAAVKAQIGFDFSLDFTAPNGLKSSWQNWRQSYQDEITASTETSQQALFWQRLNQAMPTLTVIDPDETAQWIRTQGLSPQILTNGLNSIRVSNHRYYPNGCLVSKGNDQRWSLRMIQQPYSPPQNIDADNIIAMHCLKNATFVVSAETPQRIALYYQPEHGSQAWKSTLNFQDSIADGDLSLHVDDDLVCLFSEATSGQNRGAEIQCLDRKTGLFRWETRRFPGNMRGIAFDENKISFANDQALFSISRTGELLHAQRIQTSPRLRRRLYCQLQNRLIFMTGPGQFVAWNMNTDSFDWQTAVFESEFLHCSQQNILILSEAGGYLLAYDVEQNTPIWKFRTVSIPLDAFSYGGYIYILLPRAILVLDRTNGRRRAQIPLPWKADHFIQMGPKLFLDTEEAVYTWR